MDTVLDQKIKMVEALLTVLEIVHCFDFSFFFLINCHETFYTEMISVLFITQTAKPSIK